MYGVIVMNGWGGRGCNGFGRSVNRGLHEALSQSGLGNAAGVPLSSYSDPKY